MDNFEELYKYIANRRSIRDFSKKEIPRDVFLKIIQAASMAPNSHKAEPWFFYIVDNQEIINKMRKAVIETYPKSDWIKKYGSFFNAPYLIVACINMEKRWYHREAIPGEAKELEALGNADYFAVAAAIQNLLLSAHSFGLGACWLGTRESYRKKLERILNIEKPYRIAANIAIGHYDEIPPTPHRKPAEEICEFIK